MTGGGRSHDIPALLLALVVLAATAVAFHRFNTIGYGVDDFIQYWAAARIALEGGNPYDSGLIDALQRAAWPYERWFVRDDMFPVLMWNPPTIFPLILPLGLFDFPTAATGWLLVQSMLIVASIVMVHDELSKEEAKPAMICLLATFYPLHLTLWWGQLSGLLLFAFAAALRCWRIRPVLAGVALGFTLFKPHLLHLLYSALVWTFLFSNGRRKIQLSKVACGVSCTLLALVAVPLVWFPELFGYYAEALRREPPIYWVTPTFGGWLQHGIGVHQVWVRFVPTVLAQLLLLGFALHRRLDFAEPRMLALLVPISVVTSPYGWPFDFVLMIPAVCTILAVPGKSARRPRWFGPLLLANAAMGLTADGRGMEELLWYPLALTYLAVHVVHGCGVESGTSTGSADSSGKIWTTG